MTEFSQPWPGQSGIGDTGPYTADQWSDMYRDMYLAGEADQGVRHGYLNELAVTISASGPPDTIQVDTGGALVDGKWYFNTAAVTEVQPAASAGSYLVVLEKTFDIKSVRISIRIGAALVQNDGILWEIPLASFTLAADGTVSALVDTRVFIPWGVGKQTLWLPASGMGPTETNGCAELATSETTALRPDIVSLDFADGGTDLHAQFYIRWPKKWNEGTITYQYYWTHEGAVSTGIAMALMGVAIGDGDTIDVAFGTPIVVTDDAQGAAEELLISAESAALTIAGSPAEGQLVAFDLFRDQSDGNEDMTQDVKVLGITLFYTTDAIRDD